MPGNSSNQWATIYPLPFLDSEFWKSLSLAEREVFRCIYRYARDKRECWPTQQTIHNNTGISIRGIRKAIKNLEKAKAISVGKHQAYYPTGKPKGRPTNLYKMLLYPLDYKQGGTECRIKGELSSSIKGNSVPPEAVHNRINTHLQAARNAARDLDEEYFALWVLFQKCRMIASEHLQAEFKQPKRIPSHDEQALAFWQNNKLSPEPIKHAIIWFCAKEAHSQVITSLKYIHTIMEQDNWYGRLDELGGKTQLKQALYAYDLLWFYEAAHDDSL